jgi:hypothetical protein
MFLCHCRQQNECVEKKNCYKSVIKYYEIAYKNENIMFSLIVATDFPFILFFIKNKFTNSVRNGMQTQNFISRLVYML